MRILHTSDWHLGRRFGEHPLLDDQATFCEWLVQVSVTEGIHLVAVAGDLFDRSVPPAEAVTLLGDTFARLRSHGVAVAAITGNHDSAERLAAYDGLLAPEVHLRGGYSRAGTVSVLTFPDGELAVAATPYLDPHLAPRAVAEGVCADAAAHGSGATRAPTTHDRVLGWALDRARAAVPRGVRSLVLSHAFVTGAAPSGSERVLSVGDAGMVSADHFRGFDYAALGHLHRSQTVAGSRHIRYSGSPLPYAFGDTGAKCVTLVDLAADGPTSVAEMEIGLGRGVTTVRGRLEHLVQSEGSTDWVRAELTDELRPVDAVRRLRHRFPWLVEVEWVGARTGLQAGLRAAEVRRRTPEELAGAFWRDVTGEEPCSEVAGVLADALHDTPLANEAAA